MSRRSRVADRLLKAVQTMPINQAMEVLGYGPGVTLDEQDLKSRYRDLARQTHPDAGGDAKEFIKVQGAFETLSKWSGRVLPSGPARDPGQVQNPYSGYPERSRSRTYPGVSLDTFREWCQKVMELGYRVMVIRDAVPWPSFGASPDFAPFGTAIQRRTQKWDGLPLDGKPVEQLILGTVQGLGFSIPESIIALNVNQNWKEAWVTLHSPNTRPQDGRERYWSISFQAPKQATKKKLNALNKSQVIQYLEQELSFLSGGPRNAYYGFGNDFNGKRYRIKVQPAALLLVVKYSDGQEIKIKSLPYGQVDKELIDSWIVLLRRYEEKNRDSRTGSFQHPGSVPVEFAQAIYRVMHNQATYQDWQILDVPSREKALVWVQEVLAANGLEGVGLAKEIRWWGDELLSKEIDGN